MRRFQRIRCRSLIAAPVFLFCISCDSSSGPDTTDVVVRFDDPAGQLTIHRDEIETAINSTAELIRDAIDVAGVTITVRPGPANVIPDYGVGGFTQDRNTVTIAIDQTFPDVTLLLNERLPRLVAHELHHAARSRGPGYGNTLFEAMVSEGLADHFAIARIPGAAPPWVQAFAEEENEYFTEMARPEFNSESYNHTGWFFVATSLRPRWCGYTLGFRFVRSYLDAHPGSSAELLVNAPASAFTPP